MKLIVAGSRDFADYGFLRRKLGVLLSQTREGISIVSGCANGADKMGERYANEHGYRVFRFPAKWSEHGKKAGFLRNVEMAKFSTHCVVFRVRMSPGSTHMIEIAKKRGLELRVYDL